MRNTVLTVKQLNSYVKSLLEGDVRLSSFYIKGEISNFKNHYQSGHLYFSLKDSDAVIRAVMFRSSAAYLKFLPSDGLSVICRGRVSLYERDGSYQLYVEEMIPDGVGDLAVAFEQTKEKLAKLGYFDITRKKAIPKLPRNIAVITSDTGAAVQDIINILSRRYPLCGIVMCPVHVQGDLAVPELVDALERVNRIADVDTIIIGRGGGSVEDLWAFNSEELAKAIFASEIPVISAVGHETDFTICDFVADLRAPTPSAAAELAVPDINELSQTVDIFHERLLFLGALKLKDCEKRFENLTKRSVLSDPEMFYGAYHDRVLRLYERLTANFNILLEQQRADFGKLTAKLNLLSPLNVLSRGYSIVTKDKRTVSTTDVLSVGDSIDIKFLDGNAQCTVASIGD